jgi:predicted peptidase
MPVKSRLLDFSKHSNPLLLRILCKEIICLTLMFHNPNLYEMEESEKRRFIKASYYFFVLVTMISFGCTVQKPQNLSDFYQTSDGWALPYRLYYPAYGQNQKWPLILFLHGAGERGKDNEKQSVHVVPYLTSDSIQRLFPAVILAPQCPENDYWAPVKRFEWSFVEGGKITNAMAGVLELMKTVRKDPRIDTTRIYVIGLSMGGFGTYDIISRRPDWFAAGVPICGGGDTTKWKHFENTPLWIFHGTDDNVVPVQKSREMHEILQKQGITGNYTEYEGEGHGVWEKAIREQGLMQWMFSQNKGNKK